MILINSKLFLTELSKMLAFMHDEDRLTALSMYEKMFSNAQDQEALLALLKSPTKQAVLLARSYDAKARKKELSGAVTSTEVPDFVSLISDISEYALDAAGYSYTSPQSNITEAPVSRSASEDQADSEDDKGSFDQNSYEPTFSNFNLDFEKEIISYIAESSKPLIEDSPERIAYQEENPPYTATAISATSPTAEESDHYVSDLEPEKNVLHAPDETVVTASKEVVRHGVVSVQQPYDKTPINFSGSKERTNIFLAILYSLAAIPLTVLIILLLLVFALVSLGTSVLSLLIGVKALMSCFGSFAVFADIMAVMGASFILIALGVLFFWIFIWLIVKAIVGVIKGSFRLGKILCTEGRSAQ